MSLLLLQTAQDLIEQYNINLIHLVFIGFTTIIVFFGSLVNLIEQRLPIAIRQSFRYGKHSHKGPGDAMVNRLEVPKAWFSHFYVFAFSWALLALFLVLKVVFTHTMAPEYVLSFLDFMAGGQANRKVQVDSNSALVASMLMALQCARRFYETNFVQIFSKKSKINLSHYLVGYIHYFGAIVAILANTEGFVRDTQPDTFSFSKIPFYKYQCITVFLACWWQQYESNMLLVNLRKNAKTGEVATEQHLLPKGGAFEFVSSPHMFFEVFMYVILIGILPRCITWYLVAIWVLSNQLVNALLTHKWYKETFKDYPKERFAIIPFIL